MTGDEVREVLAARLPQEAIDHCCAPCGVIARPRQLNLGMCVRAMVISAGTPGGAYPAAVWRSSLACEVPHVARSACSRWCAAPLEQGMEALAQRGLADAQAPPVDLSGPLGGVQAWSMVDATTVTGRDALREEVPGTGDDAALKVHTVVAVGCGAPGRDHVRPAREHDRRQLTMDEAWRGCGRLAARGAASLARLRAGSAHEVRFGIRLQDHWKPTVDPMARGQVPQECFPGTDLAALLEAASLVLDGRALAADVHGGGDQRRLHLRRVGVHTPKGDGCFRTHLPPRLGPRPMADLARVRWEVERRSRLDQSGNRRDAIDAERPCALKTLLHASRVASTIAARLAHPHHLQTRPTPADQPRLAAPLHPRRLALHLAVSCPSIAQAFDLQGVEAQRRGDKRAARLTPSGTDPPWRRRPSVLDHLRGWKRQPMTRKGATGGDASRGHLKAAA
jgi:hypothetical protein